MKIYKLSVPVAGSKQQVVNKLNFGQFHPSVLPHNYVPSANISQFKLLFLSFAKWQIVFCHLLLLAAVFP